MFHLLKSSGFPRFNLWGGPSVAGRSPQKAPGCAFSGRDGGSLSRCGALAAGWAAKSLVAGKFCRRCDRTAMTRQRCSNLVGFAGSLQNQEDHPGKEGQDRKSGFLGVEKSMTIPNTCLGDIQGTASYSRQEDARRTLS